MVKFLSILLVIITAAHGLIHLMGFAAYWPLVKIAALPYKTSLLGGRWDVDAAGMRLFSVLWLLAAVGSITSAVLLAVKQNVWAPVMLVSVLLSLLLCILDWQAAFRGAIVDLVLLLVLGIVFGLRAKPAPFPAYSSPVSTPSAAIDAFRLPGGLPEPVDRFYRLVYGDKLPVVESAVYSGRGTIRFMGVTMPARLRFSHQAGYNYRHYMETTFYGFSIFKVNEHFIDGHSRLELPFGVVENDPIVDAAANQGLWAESVVFSSLFLTDPRLRWEAIDDRTAHLYVPWGGGEQRFIASFDPASGLLTRFETIRQRDAKTAAMRWWGELTYSFDESGRPAPSRMAVTWEDEGSPWLVAEIEELVLNSDLREYIRQRGP